VVLRRADEKRLPMEIPEAREIAAEEVIVMEVEDEKRKTKEDEKANAEEIEKTKLDKLEVRKSTLVELKERKKEWAIKKINKFYKLYLAKQIMRKKARRYAYVCMYIYI
jgi:flagellar biosynthesis GTPase FlhF